MRALWGRVFCCVMSEACESCVDVTFGGGKVGPQQAAALSKCVLHEEMNNDQHIMTPLQALIIM